MVRWLERAASGRKYSFHEKRPTQRDSRAQVQASPLPMVDVGRGGALPAPFLLPDWTAPLAFLLGTYWAPRTHWVPRAQSPRLRRLLPFPACGPTTAF